MKITQSWHINEPTTYSGYSITLTTVYSSKDKAEIDDLEQKMPKGMIVMDGNYNVESSESGGQKD